MEYSTLFKSVLEFFMNNDKDKLNLLMSDKSKNQPVFTKVFLHYILISLIILVYMLLIFYRFWDYKIDFIPIVLISIIWEILSIVMPMLLSVSLAYNYAISSYLDKRYKRFENENLYDEGKKYPNVYGSFLKEIKKLRRKSYVPYLLYGIYIAMLGLNMYFVKVDSFEEFLFSSVNWIFYALSITYFLTSIKVPEYSGKVKFCNYLDEYEDLKGTNTKIWKGIRVYLNDPYYYLFDDNIKKFAKYEIFSKSLFDSIEKIYREYLKEKARVIIEFYDEQKSKLIEQRKSNPKKTHEINLKISNIDNSIREVEDFLSKNF